MSGPPLYDLPCGLQLLHSPHLCRKLPPSLLHCMPVRAAPPAAPPYDPLSLPTAACRKTVFDACGLSYCLPGSGGCEGVGPEPEPSPPEPEPSPSPHHWSVSPRPPAPAANDTELLLAYKLSFSNGGDVLASWTDEEGASACEWAGVVCSDDGRVLAM